MECTNENLIEALSIQDAVEDLEYDAHKDKLIPDEGAQEKIRDGYILLREIEELIRNNDRGDDWHNVCKNFFDKVHPMENETPGSLITTLEEVEHEKKLLDLKMVATYLGNGIMTGFDLELQKVFKCVERRNDANFSDFGNRWLLWHGAELKKWPRILSEGFQIPPELPSYGPRFGNGIYFADISTKSAIYCKAGLREKALLLLCDVSLGETNDKQDNDSGASTLPEGKHSVRCLGSMEPEKSGILTLHDGLQIPLGKPVRAENGARAKESEYVVYDTRQIRMKYLVQVKLT